MSFGARITREILDCYFNGSSISAPLTIYVSLHTGDPGEDGQGAGEISGNNYSRVAAGPSVWGAANGDNPATVTNTSKITFPVPTGSWGTVTYFGVWTHATNTAEAYFIGAYELSASVAVDADNPVKLAIGACVIKAGISQQIIIDHNSVAQYASIPSSYITEIKKLRLNILGQSHSLGYRIGLQLLEDEDSTYSVSITESAPPEAYREDALRVDRLRRRIVYSDWIESSGEQDFYTNSTARGAVEDHIDYCEDNSLNIAAFGFGWCWDMTWGNGPTDDEDPVYGCHWYGTSVSGPEGDLEWGLDSGDYSITSNTVCMDTYLSAVQQFIDHCASEGHDTNVIYTTGPVDGYSGENGYQRHVKHEYIRAHVLADSSRILFDYADILAWSNAGQENIQTWDGHDYQMIHSDNMLDLDEGYEEDGDHIGKKGALRLGKAVWVMLARILGWNP